MFNTGNWKHKAGLMALGSIFTIIGMLFAIGFLPSVTAQRDKFGDIECTSLSVDAKGKGRVVIKAGEEGGYIMISDEHGKPGTLISIGSVSIRSAGGKSASLSSGFVGVSSNDGKLSASLDVDKRGGRVNVRGKRGGSVVMRINENSNGIVSTFDKKGYRLNRQ